MGGRVKWVHSLAWTGLVCAWNEIAGLDESFYYWEWDCVLD